MDQVHVVPPRHGTNSAVALIHLVRGYKQIGRGVYPDRHTIGPAYDLIEFEKSLVLPARAEGGEKELA